jgi:hypothetical protein
MTSLDIIKREFELMPEEKEEFINDLYPEIVPDKLPSRFSKEFKSFKTSYVLRGTYTNNIGFALLSQEFAYELREVLPEYNIRTFVELEAGNGTLTILLNNIVFDGKGYTLKPADDGKHWGFKSDNRFCEQALSTNLLEFKDIREVTIDNNIDMIVASWIPYEGGQEVIDFFESNSENIPDYFLLIGEGEGGCTASDDFFDWLGSNFEEEYIFKQFVSFEAIYDSCILYKRRK